MFIKTSILIFIWFNLLQLIGKFIHSLIESLNNFINWFILELIPFQRCQTGKDCVQFCADYGYNRSECSTTSKRFQTFRLNKFCECHDCDFVQCATYCTKNNLKFIGCSCFSLPALVGQGNYPSIQAIIDSNQLLTNECYDNKFFCQCSK